MFYPANNMGIGILPNSVTQCPLHHHDASATFAENQMPINHPNAAAMQTCQLIRNAINALDQ